MALNTAKVLCLCLILLGIVALLVGSASPFWLTPERLTVKQGLGLWFFCVDGTSETYKWDNLSWGDYSRWFYTTHVLAGMATLLAAMMLFISLFSICGERGNTTFTGVLALICGLLGIAAGAVFYAKSVESLQIIALRSLYRGWSFFVFAAGSCVITVFSIVLLILSSCRNDRSSSYY